MCDRSIEALQALWQKQLKKSKEFTMAEGSKQVWQRMGSADLEELCGPSCFFWPLKSKRGSHWKVLNTGMTL